MFVFYHLWTSYLKTAWFPSKAKVIITDQKLQKSDPVCKQLQSPFKMCAGSHIFGPNYQLCLYYKAKKDINLEKTGILCRVGH